MLQLLNTQTGHKFILPDEEALKIKKNDRTNIFLVLDCGFKEEKEEQINLREVLYERRRKQGVVTQQKKHEAEPIKEYDVDLEKLSKKDLITMLKKLKLKANFNEHKEDLIKRLRDNGVS